ncbi:hypothetical protein [Tractidigestivibacter sp.]|uniref:hypothetical protein n=1 Tax=Tractidigestivibacter sp. TaxID=2847320 RepID=UPI002A91409F|nr:hypothetical protein [Tractidigestivibacter sp.]MDY5272512.1 hypothetical protein [Tractidigestivibacter sp.]
MSMVAYNQTGYDGQSMSIRAREAYESGEMPKSRWTKAAMLAAIQAWCRDADRVVLPEVAKLRRDELFERLFTAKSWHHTGKYAAATDFYGVDEDAADAFSRPMTGEELAEVEAERDAERARGEAKAEEHARAAKAEGEARRAARQRAIDALGPAYDYIAARNPVYTSQHTIIRSMAADEAIHPEDYEARVAKSGRVMLRLRSTGLEMPLERACTYEL